MNGLKIKEKNSMHYHKIDNPIRYFKSRGIETTLSRYSEQGDLRTLICASAGKLGECLTIT